jgi:putative intracellular protease/amidase
MKPRLKGLLYMGTPSADLGLQGAVSGAVAQVNWADIVPTFSNVFQKAPVENAISAVMNTGVKNVRLRVLGGIHAPTWLIHRGFFEIIEPSTRGNPNPGATLTYPTFWTTEYRAQADALIAWLGEQYDSDERVSDVCFGVGVTTEFCEWPIRQIANNYQAYTKAGWSASVDQQNIMAEVASYHAAFPNTWKYYADSVWYQDGAGTDAEFTQSVITTSRTLGGVIHGTNNLDAGSFTNGVPQWLAQNKVLPMSFQCQSASNETDCKTGLSQALVAGAGSVEMQGMSSINQKNMTIADWVAVNKALQNNP